MYIFFFNKVPHSTLYNVIFFLHIYNHDTFYIGGISFFSIHKEIDNSNFENKYEYF